MTHRRRVNWGLGLIPVTAVALCTGCSTGDSVYAGLDRGDRLVTPAPQEEPRDRTVGFINGRPVTIDELWAPIAEGLGRQVLEDLVLDRELARQARLAGIQIGEDDVRGERSRLARTLSRGELSDEAIGALLGRLRDDRGLGPARYDALLWRNAILRRLVSDDVQIDQAEIERAYEIVFGERFQIRLIVVASDREATRVRGDLAGETDDLATRFAQAARAVSIDPSGEFGGAMDPISPVDPIYPGVLRSALSATGVGDLTPVLVLDGAYAIALIERKIEPEATTLDAERARLVRVLRDRKERSAMGEVAARLVRESEVEIIDRSLAWSWDRRER